MENELAELRKLNHLTQREASQLVGVPLRTYVRYENDSKYIGSMKYKYMIDTIVSAFEITEEKGLLTLQQIKDIVKGVLDTYQVEYCFLFGSYAKGYATGKSDVDLMIDCEVEGIHFFGLIEDLRVALHKQVDLIRVQGLGNNLDLLREILKDGIKIYEQHKK